MDVLVLGPVAVLQEAERVPIGGPKQRGVIALLATNVGSPISLDRIVAGIYGDDAPSRAARSVQTFVSALRRELGDVISKDGTGYSLVIDPMSIDAIRFEHQVQEGMALVDDDPELAANSLREALALWRGEPYADVNNTGIFTPEVTRLTEIRLSALGSRIDAELANGRHRELIGELEAIISDHPLRERFRGQVMLAYYRSGRQADALRAFERTRTYLAEELGIDPSPELRDLEQRVLEQDPALDHTAPSHMPVRGNMPERITPFLGRSEEVAQIADLVAQRRLLTLTGLGGIGKTTLAIEAARRVADGYPGGAWVVELAHLDDDESVLGEFGRALGIVEHPTQPLLDILAEELTDKSMIVVVDNCEHVIGEVCRIIDAVLHRCRDVHVLATSREPLQIPGERVWRVPPLATPDADTETPLSELARFDAVQLFVERARDIDPGFAIETTNASVVAAICRRLDGIPLALELAAARLRVLSPTELLKHLVDRFAVLTAGGRSRPDRHQTLLATMDWSHRLLSLAEQEVLHRLAVFRGGFTLDAAAAVCSGDGVEAKDMLDHVNRLLDASLLTRNAAEPPRYGMLDTVRDFAASSPRRPGEMAAVRRRHASHFCGSVEGEREFDSPEFGEMLEHLAAEQANFREALSWSVEAGEPGMALRLMNVLDSHWFFTAQADEALRWIPRVLRIADPAPTATRASLLNALGTYLSFAGRREEALAVLEEGMAAADQLNDPQAKSEAIFARSAFLEVCEGDFRGSRDVLLRHHEKTRALEYPFKSLILVSLAETSIVLGDFGQAAACAGELEESATAHGQQMTSAWVDNIAGSIAHYRGDLATAEQRLRRSVRVFTQLNRIPNTTEPLAELAQIALANGELEKAQVWARRVLELGRQSYGLDEVALGHALLARVALQEGLISIAVLETSRALDITVDSGNIAMLAAVLPVVGQCARAVDDATPAAVLHSGAEVLRDHVGLVHPAPRAQELEHEYEELRKSLGGARYEAARNEGASLNRDDLATTAERLLAKHTPGAMR
jgi:predicted ATPase/DNA-binding SARP family transcriptional activator